MSDRTVIGSPPTLEWVAIERLEVDPLYQRVTDGPKSRKLLFSMQKLWDWRLCQPLAVSRREDGRLLVVDGQHRLNGASKRGDIPHLPCVITVHSGAEDEAATFVALNQCRQRLSQGDIFKASLATGDQRAHQAHALIERAGLTLAPHGNPASWKPGQVFCGPAVQNAVRIYGETVVSCALVALAEAYQGKVLVRGGTLLHALYVIYRDHAGGDFDPDTLISALGSVEQLDWIAEAAGIRQGGLTISTRDALVQAIMTEYRALIAEGREAA